MTVSRLKSPALVLLACTVAATPLAAEDDPIWTTKPVRVDRSKQEFERLPRSEERRKLLQQEQGRFIVRLPVQIKVVDSATFSARGVQYAFSDIRPVPADKICTSDAGTRWPCGKTGSLFSGRLLSGKLLQCESVLDEGGVKRLSGCRTAGKSIAAEILANGQGFAAAGDPDLVEVVKAAREARKGVWRDRACYEANDGC